MSTVDGCRLECNRTRVSDTQMAQAIGVHRHEASTDHDEPQEYRHDWSDDKRDLNNADCSMNGLHLSVIWEPPQAEHCK
jgi:hypothetical protein